MTCDKRDKNGKEFYPRNVSRRNLHNHKKLKKNYIIKSL